MNLRSFEVPTIMKHSLGAINAVAGEAKAMDMKRPLVVTDPGIAQAGLLARLAAPLKAGSVDYIVFDRVAPSPPIALVDEAAQIYSVEGCDGLIALGGGSAMDAAKSIGVVTANGGSILNYEWLEL